MKIANPSSGEMEPCTDCDRLKAEVESYKRAKAENDERFQLQAGALRLDLEREREANAKLREALEKIRDADRTITGKGSTSGDNEAWWLYGRYGAIALHALLAANMSPESQNIDTSKERVADDAKQHTPSEDEELHNAFVKHLKAKEAKQDETIYGKN